MIHKPCCVPLKHDVWTIRGIIAALLAWTHQTAVTMLTVRAIVTALLACHGNVDSLGNRCSPTGMDALECCDNVDSSRHRCSPTGVDSLECCDNVDSSGHRCIPTGVDWLVYTLHTVVRSTWLYRHPGSRPCASSNQRGDQLISPWKPVKWTSRWAQVAHCCLNR